VTELDRQAVQAGHIGRHFQRIGRGIAATGGTHAPRHRHFDRVIVARQRQRLWNGQSLGLGRVISDGDELDLVAGLVVPALQRQADAFLQLRRVDRDS